MGMTRISKSRANDDRIRNAGYDWVHKALSPEVLQSNVNKKSKK